MKALLNLLEREIKTRGISSSQISDIIQNNKDLINRRIIAGYASVDMVDREGQRIPISALQSAVDEHMKNIFARPVMVFHSDVQVGRLLPKWTDPKSGKTYENHVDETGWFVVCEIRDDTEIASKTWEEIIKGNLRSFSIAGSSKEKLQKNENGVSYEEVKTLEIYETTICEIPVNQMSKFSVLWNPNQITI